MLTFSPNNPHQKIKKVINNFTLNLLSSVHQHFIAINMAAGSVKNFFSLNSTLLNGVGLDVKPWNDTG